MVTIGQPANNFFQNSVNPAFGPQASRKSGSVRFGHTAAPPPTGDKAPSLATAFPWAKDVVPPKYNLEELVESVQKSAAKGGFLSALPKLAWHSWMISRELEKTSRKYLPAEAKKHFHWSRNLNPMFWYKRLAHPAEFKRMEVVYQGPAAIKAMQAWVESSQFMKVALEGEVAKIKAAKARRKAGKEDGPGFLGHVKEISIQLYAKCYFIPKVQTYESLRSEVPLLPDAEFKVALASLEKAYNSKNPAGKIKAGSLKAIKSGSVCQVYLGETADNKKVIFKAARNMSTPAFFEACKPYIYFLNMVMTSSKADARLKCAKEATEQSNMLLGELKFEEEHRNGDAVRDAIDVMGAQDVLGVPQVYVSSKDGMVQEFVGDQDYAKLSGAEQAKVSAKAAESLSEFMALGGEKLFDLHGGNARVSLKADKTVDTSKKLYLLDFGRHSRIKPEMNLAMKNLMMSVYLVDYNEGYSEDPRHMFPYTQNADVITDLLGLYAADAEGKACGNKYYQALTRIKASNDKIDGWKHGESFGGGRLEDAIKEELVETTKKDRQLIDSMLKVLFDNHQAYNTDPFADLQQMQEERAAADTTKTKSHDMFTEPKSFYRVWTNWMILNKSQQHRDALPVLTEHPISGMDLKQSQVKATGFIAPYFVSQDETTTDAILIDHYKGKVKDVRSFMKTFGAHVFSLKHYGLIDKEDMMASFSGKPLKSALAKALDAYNTANREKSEGSRATSTKTKPELDAAVTAAETGLMTAWNHFINTPSTQRTEMLDRNRIELRYKQMATSQADALTRQTGWTLDEDQRGRLIGKIEAGLRQDIPVDKILKKAA